MSRTLIVAVNTFCAALPLTLIQPVPAGAQDLQSFAVVAGQSLTNTGPTTIVGNIAVSPGTSYTGSGSVTQDGSVFIGDALSISIQDDLTSLYNVLIGRPTSQGGDLTGQDLGGMTLQPGVYHFDSSASIAAGQTLTLDGGGNPDAVFIFNIGSTLTAGSGATVVLQNGAQGGNVFYRVGSSATLGTSSDLQGQIVALTSITLNTAASIGCGAAQARNGSVTLDTNTIAICTLQATGFEVVVPPETTPPTTPPTTPVVSPPAEVPPAEVPADAPPAEVPPTEVPPTEVPPEEVPADVPTAEPVTGEGAGSPPATVAPVVTSPVAVVVPVPEAALATALAEHVSAGGTLPYALAILPAAQTAAELAASLSQLTSEVSTVVAPMQFQAMSGFLDTVVGSGRSLRLPALTRPDDGVPRGMVPEKIHSAYSGKFGSEPPTLTYTAIAAAPRRDWNAWVSAYGSTTTADADPVLGYQDRTFHDQGIALGLNHAVGDRTNLGVALSWSTAAADLEDGSGRATAESVFVALRGRTGSDRAYVEGALGLGRSDIATDRRVTVAGLDRFIGATTGTSVAAYVEAGYRYGAFTPFAALRAQSSETAAYSETVVEGVSSYALNHAATRATSVRSELGVDLGWSRPLPAGGVSSFGVRAAWAHDFGGNETSSAAFQSLPDVAFPITAAALDRDSLVLSASVGIASAGGVSIDGSLNLEQSANARSYGGAITLGYRW